ncbi:hypothetical protein [Sulfitobacter faviae]|uniref:hypothetical protein n=1 Tax=Sulfitobacter faviae TaxID=1775881 RepID=UPI00398CE84A
MSGWLDMSSAPKTGERFLATDGKVVSIVRRNEWINPTGWSYDGEDVEYDAFGQTEPCVDVASLTGWQPLPNP